MVQLSAVRQCKDCRPATKRLAPFPGPRCATHNRAFKRKNKTRAHELMVARIYGLLPGQYEAMYKQQGGVCAICKRATGKTKRLAVDHDHATGRVRGLACGPCNQFIGYVNNDPNAFQRGADYLRRPVHPSLDGWGTNDKVFESASEG